MHYLLTGRNKLAEIPWLTRYHFGRINDARYLSLFNDHRDRVRGEIMPAYRLLETYRKAG